MSRSLGPNISFFGRIPSRGNAALLAYAALVVYFSIFLLAEAVGNDLKTGLDSAFVESDAR